MKKRYIYYAIIIIAFIAVVWWGLRHRHVEGIPSVQSQAESSNSSPTVVQTAATPVTVEPRGPAPQPSASTPPSSIPSISATGTATLIEKFSQQIHRPIEFYGKVVDENGQPVQGATITFGWTHLVAPESSNTTNAISDRRGLFSLSGVVGATLSVGVEKDGYYPATIGDQTSFSYSQNVGAQPFQPDSNNPVLFHLRKKGQAEPLVARNVTLPVPRDGSTVGFDPLRCKLTSDGPLLFRFTPADRAGSMKLQIRASGGGLHIAEGQFPFEAPDSGYSEVLEFSETDKKQFPSEIQCFFYFGVPRQYGRFSFSKFALSGSDIGFLCFVNTSGSRNLETEPGKFVQPVPDYYLQPNSPLIDTVQAK